MSTPPVNQLLASTLSPNDQERNGATQQLEQFSSSAFPEYVQALATELGNANTPSHIRNAAGLAIKNSLTAKEITTRDLYSQRWSACSEQTRLFVKQIALSSLSSADRPVRNVAAQVVAAIATLELPLQAWPDLMTELLGLATQGENNHLRQAALQTIGYICENITPETLSNQSNQILTAVVQGVRKEEPNDDVRLAAMTALTNSLEFIRSNFEREGERNYIMQVVCEATQSPAAAVQVAAFEGLVRIMQLFYDKMRYYMERALFGLTVLGMKNEDENVSLQAVEFWSTVCDEEIDLAAQAEEAIEYDEPLERESQHFARIALPEILPVLLQLLMKQEEDATDNEWNISMAAGTCLALLAQAVGDGIVTPIIPFVEANIRSSDWHQREAAVMAFGSIISGPEPDLLQPLVAQALPTLLEMMRDSDPHVRDTTAWTLARICDTLVHTIDRTTQLPDLVSALVLGLNESARIASSCCWGLMNLANEMGRPTESTSDISSYFDGVSGALLSFTENNTTDSASRSSGYEALSSWSTQASADCLGTVSRLMLTALARSEQLLQVQGQLLGSDEKNNYNEVQCNLCALFTSIIRRLDEQIKPLAGRIMTVLLQLIQTAGLHSPVLEDAFMCVGATASVIEQDFQQYLTAFLPFLSRALQSHEEYQLCGVSVGLIADICRALGPLSSPFCRGFIEALLAALQSNVLHRSVKPSIITCFGDIAAAIGGDFEPFVETTMSVLQQAGMMRADPTDFDLIDYIAQLRESILEAMTGIVASMKLSGQILLPYVPSIFAFLQLVLMDQDRTENIIKAGVGLIGDLADAFPHGSIKPQLSNEWISESLKVARTRCGSEGKTTAKWAKEMIKRAST